jgi:hypothetical protein
MSFSYQEETQLRDILKNVEVRRMGSYAELRLKNVEMWTDIVGEACVAVINTAGTAGVQRPLGIRGASKCIICDEYDNAGLVCENCRIAVSLVRAAGVTNSAIRVIDTIKKIEEAGLIDALSLITRDTVKNWMDAQTEDMK